MRTRIKRANPGDLDTLRDVIFEYKLEDGDSILLTESAYDDLVLNSISEGIDVFEPFIYLGVEIGIFEDHRRQFIMTPTSMVLVKSDAEIN